MTDASSKPRRRWFQFSLRSLLIAVTLAAGLLLVAGVLVAWRVYVEPYRQQREVMKLIEELGGSYKTELGGPSWLRGLFGDDNFQNLIEISLYDTAVSDADLAHLERLQNLQGLSLAVTPVTNAGLAHLEGLANLEWLYLSDTSVSDAGLAHLKGLTNLRTLFLRDTKIGDAGLAHLKGLTSLRALYLHHTKVSDAGLAHLKAFTNLQVLELDGTQVSDAGVKDLRKALPNCTISTDRIPMFRPARGVAPDRH